MGHHYVPRHHLRRFAIPGENNCVWLYDRQTRAFRKAGIASVAQEREFYDPEIEAALAGVVEGPGKIVIDKLLNREPIDNAERTTVSLYFMTMMTRGPRRRKKAFDQVPEVLAEVIAETEGEIQKWIAEEPENERAHQRLQELYDVKKKFACEIPQNIIDQIRRPFWSDRTVECIHNMVWHVLPAPPGVYYVTCDTPAHSFDCYGVGTNESEFTITLSRDYAIVGEHSRTAGIVYERPQAQISKEINRRILSHTDRFVFSPRSDIWIDTIVQKKSPYLSRIRWR